MAITHRIEAAPPKPALEAKRLAEMLKQIGYKPVKVGDTDNCTVDALIGAEKVNTKELLKTFTDRGYVQKGPIKKTSHEGQTMFQAYYVNDTFGIAANLFWDFEGVMFTFTASFWTMHGRERG